MGRINQREKDVLNQLVVDCSMYNFSERDSLEYIKRRFGKEVSGRTYRRYKADLENGNITQDWMNYFNRTGFIVQHQQLLFAARNLLQSSMRLMVQEDSKEEQATYSTEGSAISDLYKLDDGIPRALSYLPRDGEQLVYEEIYIPDVD